MDSERFQTWLQAIDGLSAAQKREVQNILAGRSSEAEVIAALEARVLADRRCVHCGKAGVICRGRSNGLRRLYCQACGKTFNALTGTPLAHLHLKGRWFAFARSLAGRETVRKSAAGCAVALSTAFRWRHRFLGAIKTDAGPLSGIVEADETYVLESRKGSRAWQKNKAQTAGAQTAEAQTAGTAPDRASRKRGGRASKRGLSAEQVPVLVAADRGGNTVSAILPQVTAQAISDVLRPVIAKDALLVTDAASVFAPCAATLGISHQALPAGAHKRGELHIQTVNSRHERLKDMLRRHRGVATKYLGSYLKWFHLATLKPDPTPRACLDAAIGCGCAW